MCPIYVSNWDDNKSTLFDLKVWVSNGPTLTLSINFNSIFENAYTIKRNACIRTLHIGYILSLHHTKITDYLIIEYLCLDRTLAAHISEFVWSEHGPYFSFPEHTIVLRGEHQCHDVGALLSWLVSDGLGIFFDHHSISDLYEYVPLRWTLFTTDMMLWELSKSNTLYFRTSYNIEVNSVITNKSLSACSFSCPPYSSTLLTTLVININGMTNVWIDCLTVILLFVVNAKSYNYFIPSTLMDYDDGWNVTEPSIVLPSARASY